MRIAWGVYTSLVNGCPQCEVPVSDWTRVQEMARQLPIAA